MPTFKYTARNPEGKVVSGKIVADNEPLIVAELRKRDLVIVSIKEEKEIAFSKSSKAKGDMFAKKVTAEDIVIFTRQFATMIDAGIPILQALEALSDQTMNPTFKAVLMNIKEDIQLGSGLSAAFSKHPKAFGQLYVNMIRVGETGGILTTILDRVAQYLEKSEKLRQKVQSAMIYPMVVISMALGISVLLIIKVVPTFAQIYDSLGQKLPAMTQGLIDFSNVLQKYIGVFIGGGIALFFGIKQACKTEQGALLFDKFLLKLPVFGDLICKVAVSRFCRTFATLSSSGVPILEALDIVGKTCENKVFSILVEDIKASVKEGESIALPLSKSPYFPAMVTKMIAIGEKSGQLDKMLNKVAEFYDDQVDNVVEGLTKLIEPLIIGVLGVIIGFIVIALFMPILNLTTAIQ